MTALLLRYKNDADSFLPGLPATQQKITFSAKNITFFRRSYRTFENFF
jgi:hypothetical protein